MLHTMATAATSGGRADTEARLEDAALRLVARDGVLAGLNLYEVAEAAGVNRGLLYRYYGSRQELLRRAYKRLIDRVQPRRERHSELPLRERFQRDARALITHPRWAHMVCLLALDGDADFRAMEMSDAAIDALRRDRDAGVLPRDTDIEATHAFWFAALAGYAVLRQQLARDLAVKESDLDNRVLAVIDRLVRNTTTSG